MDDVYIGMGNMHGRGVYAARDFSKDEVVIAYHLNPLSKKEFETLSKEEQDFVHEHWGKLYLYAGPERYVNHSEYPNTYQDLVRQCDLARFDIKKGEEITTNAYLDDIPL